MKINVEGIDVETREIVSIREAGWRMHGFIIQLTEGRMVNILERQEYYMCPSDCGMINDRYRALRDKVKAKWDEDKRDIPTLTL